MFCQILIGVVYLGLGLTSVSIAAVDDPGLSPQILTIEKIEVTGSHIRRVEVEGVAPVVILDRKELDKTGYNSVSDVLRETSVSSFGGAREASGSNAAGNAEVDLRGLGSANTLVLLNGQRLPSDAVTGAVDLNMIPMAAVERVEILKDGASAIYGSDALGGVVNIITRKDFSGTEAEVTQTLPEKKGGERTQVSLVNGTHSESFNIVNVIQYRNNQIIFSRDRPWTSNGVSNIGSPGSYRNSGTKWNADPSCPADQVISTPEGKLCTFKYSNYSTELPDLEQLSLMSEGQFQVVPKVKLIARAGFSQRNVKWSYAAAPGTFLIPGSVADTLGSGGSPLPSTTAGKDLQVRYRLTELGTRDADVLTTAFNILTGSQIEVSRGWRLDITATHNAVLSNDRGVHGYALTSELQNLITTGAYNPFAPIGSKGSLDSARYVPEEKTVSRLSSAEAKIGGEVLEIPSGAIAASLGTTITYQAYEDKFDFKSINQEVFGNAGSSGGGQRNTQALFSEFSIPVLKNLELQLAGRYDQYSDFGNTINPKVATLYRPLEFVLFRTSVGTGFRAPLMQDLYAAASNGYPTFIDHVACQNEQKAGGETPSCLPRQYLVTSRGNAGLKEQKSVSLNSGLIMEPTKSVSLGLDWFLTKTKNVVGINLGDAMRAQSQGANLANYGVIVTRDSEGYLEEIIAPLQNLSAQEVSGFDLSLSWGILPNLKVTSTHSQLFYFREEGFPGAGFRNRIDENGRPRWRNTSTLSLIPANLHDINLTALTIAGQEKSVKEMGRLATYTSFDLAYALKIGKKGTLLAGIKNILGSTPPLDDSTPNAQLNTDLYDQIGRQFLIGYKTQF